MADDLDAVIARWNPPPEMVRELRAALRGQAGDTVVLHDDAEPAVAAVDLPSELEDLGVIGAGGMAEVRRVRDMRLNRTMAMKVLHPELIGDGTALSRFVEEAQATAQLQHPGVVPVHRLGRLADGRPFFTMVEVHGRTLQEVIDDVHDGGGTWTFRRLVGAFHQACLAVAHAHARGVVHRDLKPENIMVGEQGEVLVVDWGLAKVVGRRDWAAEAGELAAVVTDRSRDGLETQAGAVAGTPAFMSPEQARGLVDELGERSDVYALGAILYTILAGEPPYDGDAISVIGKVGAGVRPPPVHPGPGRPAELVRCMRAAMATDPADRPAGAAEVAAELMAWLDGVRRRDKALDLVAAAQALGPQIEEQRAAASTRRLRAAAALEQVPSWATHEDKEDHWAELDVADALDRQADRLDVEAERLLHAALSHDDALPEAHAALAQRYRAQHADAERVGDTAEADRAEAWLRAHAEQLPAGDPRRASYVGYLRGDGFLTVLSDPPGATVRLFRFTERVGGRLVPEHVRDLGATPLVDLRIAQGSWLLELAHPERSTVHLPVLIARQGRWDGVPPGGSEPWPVYLPRPDDLGSGDCYVPAGWTWLGGDPGAYGALPARRLWLDGFVIRRFPTTNRAWLAFLDDLVAAGREDDALRWAPRSAPGGEGVLLCGRRPDGGFLLPGSGDERWLPGWPVIHVDLAGAAAYARWLAARDGLPWRLPGELEWEKAARGVDGRIYPWGHRFDPSYACCAESHRDRALPQAVGSHPVDVSPYGVRDLAGNAKDWTADPWHPRGPPLDGDHARPPTLPEVLVGPYTARGGFWIGSSGWARSAVRVGHPAEARDNALGVRLVRALGPASGT